MAPRQVDAEITTGEAKQCILEQVEKESEAGGLGGRPRIFPAVGQLFVEHVEASICIIIYDQSYMIIYI